MPKPGDVHMVFLPDYTTREATLVLELPDGGWVVQASGLGQVDVDRRQVKKKVGSKRAPKLTKKRAPTKKAKAKKKVAPRKKKAKKRPAKKIAKKKAAPRKKAGVVRKRTRRASAKIPRGKVQGCWRDKGIYLVPEAMIEEGAINRSYFASAIYGIKPGKALGVRAFEWDGRLWAAHGGFYGGLQQPWLIYSANELIPKSKWRGKTFPSMPPGPPGTGYGGMRVTYRGKPYVLGDSSCFVPEEHVR